MSNQTSKTKRKQQATRAVHMLRDKTDHQALRLHNITIKTSHRASTSTHWHFAFTAYKAISLHTCMLSQQPNLCTDCKSTQYCTTRGHPYHSPKLHPGPCSSVGMQRGTDRHTDISGHYTFCLGYASHEM